MPDPPSQLKATLLRPDDLLSLEVTGVNVRLDTADPKAPALVVADQQQDAFLVVGLSPQTTFEQAFFEGSPTSPEQVLGPGDRPRPATTDLTPPTDPGHLAFKLGGPSRLSFRIPPDARIPYTTEGLLDWSAYTLVVPPVADVPAGAEPQGPAPIREPSATETTLQLPFRLHLAPTHQAAWQHSPTAVTHRGRTELWHTRLAGLDANGTPYDVDDQHTVGLRVVWSPDYVPGAPVPSPAETGLPGALAPMSVADRHQLVILTSAFDGYAIDEFTGFVPQPVQASLVMLSALGGWLRSYGAWTPPAQVIPPRWGPLVDIGDILEGRLDDAVQAVQKDAVQVEPAARVVARSPNALRGSLDPRIFGLPLYDVNEDARLDLSQWAHVAAQGRDHYVRLVYEGRLADTGHRASLVKVTERRFETSPSGDPTAYLRQYFYVVVKERERVYAPDGSTPRGRAMPLRHITLTTMVTPHIDYPYDPPCAITDRSFWVMVGGEDMLFHGTTVGADGQVRDFAKPMIFVPNSETEFGVLQGYVGTVENKARLSAAVPGQAVAFADAGGGDNTSFVTQSFSLANLGATRDTFFEPVLFSADVRIPAAEALTGASSPTKIRMLQQFVDQGFGDAGNATGAFAEVVKLVSTADSAPAALTGAGSDAKFNAAQSGGFATPRLDLTVLTRAHGPLGGQVGDALGDVFHPADVFPKGVATLFGVFDLADLLPTGTVDGQAPKMTVERDGTAIVTKLDWASPVGDLPAVLVTFRSLGTTLDVHVELRKELTGAGSTSVNGTLTAFDVEFLSSLIVHFTSFAFAARSGSKTDVKVDLDAARPVEFVGDLAFVEGLRKVIPPGVFGDGVSIDIISNPIGIRAGLEIGLPPATVGIFALKNISFSAGLTVPFVDGKPVVEFGFARRDAQFLLAVLIFGGGGFFHVELDTDGIRKLEAAFEFGATAALDIGIASGEVHVMAGIYFAMERKVLPDVGEQMCASLTGYLRCGGSLCVLGIVKISVEFYLSFTYYAAPIDKAKGRATLTVEVEIACFSKSVELTVERAFGGKGGDPTFADQMTTPALWAEYAQAYA
ncbi:MAG: hypothetical protein ACJ71T_10145 [Actinomycetales bacterium]